MNCGQCGRSNRPGALFCGGCGTGLTRRCAKCDAELDSDLAFCDRCGTPVGDMPAAPQAFSPAAPDTAVRKTVTVLFADLGGSTSFGERTDAELAREVMARYHAILQEVIDAHGGTVAKFMGDGMMATFGIPEIAEDDAAARGASRHRAPAALLRRSRPTVADRHGETLTLRVGINTGEVVIADGDADLIGDALNVAARLEKACRPGHVLVGEETWRITPRRVRLRGTRRGHGRGPGRSRSRSTSSPRPTPLPPSPSRRSSGAALEMQRLQSAFERAASSRTRAARHGAGLARARQDPPVARACEPVAAESDAATFEIRCDREGEATFAPIAQLIREAAGIGDDTEADAAGARERIAELFPTDDADRERLVDVLAGVFGAAPARSVEETFWAIRRLVESLAATPPARDRDRRHPVGRAASCSTCWNISPSGSSDAAGAARVPRPPGAARGAPGARRDRPARRPTCSRSTGSTRAATEQLAAGLLGTDRLPAGLIERLPASTDGNPLFVRELVRMLVDDEVIRRRDDGSVGAHDRRRRGGGAADDPVAARGARRTPPGRRAPRAGARVGDRRRVQPRRAARARAARRSSVPSLLEAHAPQGARRADRHVLGRRAGAPLPPRAHPRRRVPPAAQDHPRRPARAGRRVDRRDRGRPHRRARGRDRVPLRAGATGTGASSARSTTTPIGSAGARPSCSRSRPQRALGRDDLASAGALARRARRAACPTTDADGARRAAADRVRVLPGVRRRRRRHARWSSELAELAAGDEQLAAWAACFEAQLVGLTDPQGSLAADATATAAAETLQRARRRRRRGQGAPGAGRAARAPRSGRRCRSRARPRARRRPAPPTTGAASPRCSALRRIAALFGPSPVARAGGRCLDVVRLLRITTASPSVEATSMRCQAVLEALRGRFDVSRSMLASARASLEELGLRHGLLETELFTGMVELIAGDPARGDRAVARRVRGSRHAGRGRRRRPGRGAAGARAARSRVTSTRPIAWRPRARSSRARTSRPRSPGASRGPRCSRRAATLAAALALAEEAVEIAAATDLDPRPRRRLRRGHATSRGRGRRGRGACRARRRAASLRAQGRDRSGATARVDGRGR